MTPLAWADPDARAVAEDALLERGGRYPPLPPYTKSGYGDGYGGYGDGGYGSGASDARDARGAGDMTRLRRGATSLETLAIDVVEGRDGAHAVYLDMLLDTGLVDLDAICQASGANLPEVIRPWAFWMATCHARPVASAWQAERRRRPSFARPGTCRSRLLQMAP